MALISQEELPILKSASDVKDVADSASLEAEKMAVAKLINSAANTAQYTVIYNHPISAELLEILNSKGYSVTHPSKYTCADPETQNIISWKA